MHKNDSRRQILLVIAYTPFSNELGEVFLNAMDVHITRMNASIRACPSSRAAKRIESCPELQNRKSDITTTWFKMRIQTKYESLKSPLLAGGTGCAK